MINSLLNIINWYKYSLYLLIIAVSIFSLNACSFHLRGYSSQQFPYKSIYLSCSNTVICTQLQQTMTGESLTTLTDTRANAAAIVEVTNENTTRTARDYNSVGQIASYDLSYQVTISVFNQHNEALAANKIIARHIVMNYNNSLILAAQSQEYKSWNELHQLIIADIIRYLTSLPMQSFS